MPQIPDRRMCLLPLLRFFFFFFFGDAVGGVHDNFDALFSIAAGGNSFCVKVKMAGLCASIHVCCHLTGASLPFLGMVSRGLGRIVLAPLAFRSPALFLFNISSKRPKGQTLPLFWYLLWISGERLLGETGRVGVWLQGNSCRMTRTGREEIDRT